MNKFTVRSNAGFTLLEVLIAVVVLSIGLIGLAALMIQGQKFNRSALHRSQATFIGYDMSDRMRANRTAALAGDYSLLPLEDTDCLSTTGCNTTEMARHDLFEWGQIINNVLPGTATSSVAGSGTAGEFDITVGWQETDPQGTVVTRRYILRVRP